jgi:hypothetical protein
LCCEVRILTSELRRMQPIVQQVKTTVPGHWYSLSLIVDPQTTSS